MATAQVMNNIFHVVRLALSYGRVERGVSHPDGRPETDTDHAVSLAWLACSLAAKWYPQLDRGLIAQFAVVHDAPEVYAGDTYAVTTITAAGKDDQRDREHAATARIDCELRDLGWLPATIMHYETQSVPEARFTRAVDKLMPKIVLRIEGNVPGRLASHGVTRAIAAEFRSQEAAAMNSYAADFPEILQLRDELNAMLELGALDPGA